MTLLTGSLFWGCLFSAIVVGGLIAAIVFFFLWQGSIYFAQRLVAIIIGVIVIALIRVGVMCYGRMRYFKSFYRKKPAAANLYFLAMEWANFGVSLACGAVQYGLVFFLHRLLPSHSFLAEDLSHHHPTQSQVWLLKKSKSKNTYIRIKVS